MTPSPDTVHDAARDAAHDAVVVGAGHNGLVAAARLARAGWRVLVLERNERIGGAVQSAEITRPGFVHDQWSMNQNLFLASDAYAELKEDLERHGLEYAVSDKPYCNVFPDGRSLKVWSDVERTRAGLREHDPRDAAGFERLHERFRQFSRTLLPLLNRPMPSTKAGLAAAAASRKEGLDETQELLRLVASSTRELGERFFATDEMRALVATWGMHLDFGPDVAGGAQFPLLEVFADMENGMAIAKGGASAMPDALAAIVVERGGEVRTGAEVRRVLVEGGRATGVELVDGARIAAGRAVVANLGPHVLYDRLLADEPLPEKFRRKVDGFRHGPGTLMVHLALERPVRWAAGDEISEFAYVHVPPYVDDLARTYAQSLAGLLPDDPLLIVGQPSVFDATRAPTGKATLWVQVRTVPGEVRGDAANEIDGTDWDAIKEAYADRVMAKLETYAPGIGDTVLGRTVYSPADLERANPNLVGGDSIGGSHHLAQNFLFRPFPGWSRWHTPLENLHMVGASTWPGGGTNAGSGWMLAGELLDGAGVGKWVLGGAALAGAAALAAAAVGRDDRDDDRGGGDARATDDERGDPATPA